MGFLRTEQSVQQTLINPIKIACSQQDVEWTYVRKDEQKMEKREKTVAG